MYLVYGDSFRLIDEEIKKIIKDSDNVITMDLLKETIEDVITEALYVSMFQEKKYIIVKNANFFASQKLSDDELESLEKLINNLPSLSVIIFTTYEKIDSRKKITKDFKEKYKIINVGMLKFDELKQKVMEFVRKNNYKVSSDTCNYIINSCNNNYDLIYNELEKIFLYYNNPGEIKLDDVKNIVSLNIEDNNFKFVECVVNKNLKKALIILEDLYKEKVDPIALIMLLAREYRLMLSSQKLMSMGYNKAMTCKELGLQDWQLDKIMNSSSKYYESDLINYLEKLSLIDYEIKSGRKDKYLELKTFLLEI